jgi:nitrogen fixation protein FixH
MGCSGALVIAGAIAGTLSGILYSRGVPITGEAIFAVVILSLFFAGVLSVVITMAMDASDSISGG